MKTTSAPASAWEIRMNWGDRALEAEIVDGRGRKTLSLGDGPEELLRVGRVLMLITRHGGPRDEGVRASG